MTKRKELNKIKNEELKKLTSQIELPILFYQFDLPLLPHQIPMWRGAVAESAGLEFDLFHNHDNAEESSNSHRVRYPQIQYRSWNGRAAIWACGAGVKVARKWINKVDLTAFNIGGRKRRIKITDITDDDFMLQISPTPITYRLNDWVAFNQENYQRWQQADDLIERIKIMNEVLEGQLLGFSKAMGYELPERIEAKVLNLRSTKPVRVHNYQPMAFNILYRTNIVLPPHIAVGRHKAFGFGVQMPVKKEPEF